MQYLFLSSSPTHREQKYVWKTTAKDSIMPYFIYLLLLSAIFVGSLWFHDVWFPPEGRAKHKKQNYYHERV